MASQICAWLLVIHLVGGFLLHVYQDFNGRPGRAPAGFRGFIGSCIAMLLIWLVMWTAGAFEDLWGS
jgi:hypothetical protein